MSDEELQAVRSQGHEKVTAAATTAVATEKNSAVVTLAWAAVGIPIIYGIWSTIQKAWTFFS